MAFNKKVSQLVVAGALTGAELVPVVQSDATVQTTAQDIADLAAGAVADYTDLTDAATVDLPAVNAPLAAALALKAPLASPALTGTPTVPTAAPGTNTTQAASTAFVAAAVAAAGGGDALTTDPLSQFAATTSAQLRGVLTDETGTGAAVFATSPTLVTPALGTPSALVLTNATGLPLTTGVTGVLPVANFTTGTPDGTKFVRDDGVLATPAGGGSVATDAIWDAAGDLVQGTGANTAARLALGTALQQLRVNSGATALEYFTPTTPVLIQIACSDESTALTAGAGKVTFRAPYAFTLTGVRASVNTAPTGATLLTVDINESGTTVLSTKLTFDASEKTTTTAATAAVISDSAIADDAEISIDIDSVGSTIAGAGLKVTLLGTKP